MASKNGRVYYAHIKQMERLAKQLDKRTKSGEQEADNSTQNYHLTPEGDRVWSF